MVCIKNYITRCKYYCPLRLEFSLSTRLRKICHINVSSIAYTKSYLQILLGISRRDFDVFLSRAPDSLVFLPGAIVNAFLFSGHVDFLQA